MRSSLHRPHRILLWSFLLCAVSGRIIDLTQPDAKIPWQGCKYTECVSANAPIKIGAVESGIADGVSLNVGDVLLDPSENKARLADSSVESYIWPVKNRDTQGNEKTLYMKRIVAVKPQFAASVGALDAIPNTVDDVGFVVIDTPKPDPATRFDTLANDPLLQGVSQGLQAVLDPGTLVPASNGECVVNDDCYIIYPSATVFYTAPSPTNTGCLSTIKSKPPSPSKVPFQVDAADAYVVYSQAQNFDNCRNWLGADDAEPLTFKYKAQDLATLQDVPRSTPAAHAFNFKDLPCPPPDAPSRPNPTLPYSPILANGFNVSFQKVEITKSNGHETSRFVNCHVAAIRDPPVFAIPVDGMTGDTDGDGTVT